MENASKAILIAGAVLVVLLVVSLMMYFLVKSNEIVDTYGTEITKTQMKNHNNRYLIYEGNIAGTEVIAAATKVLTEIRQENGINMSFTFASPTTGTLTFDKDDKDSYDTIMNNIAKTLLYKVTLSYNEEGLINGMSVSPKE